MSKINLCDTIHRGSSGYYSFGHKTLYYECFDTLPDNLMTLTTMNVAFVFDKHKATPFAFFVDLGTKKYEPFHKLHRVSNTKTFERLLKQIAIKYDFLPDFYKELRTCFAVTQLAVEGSTTIMDCKYIKRVDVNEYYVYFQMRV